MNVSSYVVQIRDAPQSLQDFQQELEQFDSLLGQIKNLLYRPRKRELIKNDTAAASALLEGCTKTLQRILQEFPVTRDAITMKKRIAIVIRKDTFITTRAHVQAVSQSLQLLLQKIAITETFHVADTQELIRDNQDQMIEAQKKTDEEITKLGSILEDMRTKINSLQGYTSRLDARSQNLTSREREDPESEVLEEIVQETYAGVDNIESYYAAVRLFESDMRERAQNVRESDDGSLSTRINRWVGDVPVEPATTLDEGIDMRSPTQSRRSSEPENGEDEIDEDAEPHDPQIMTAEIEFFQKAVDRQVAVGAFGEAKKNQRISITLREKLEHLHREPFTNRIEMMQRLAWITMQEGKPKSYEEARDILRSMKRHVKRENLAMLSELDHLEAVTYAEECKAIGANSSRPLGDREVGLLKKAELRAIRALKGREQLAGPPRDVIRESVKFLTGLYDQLDEPSKRFAYNQKYGEFLADETMSTASTDVQLPPEEATPLRPLSTGDHHQFPPEEIWLMDRGFGLGPHDYINTPHNETKLTPLITAIRENNQDADKMAYRFIQSLQADVNRVDTLEDWRISPLMWAVKVTNQRMVQTLIDARADSSFRDKRKRSMMHVGVDANSTWVLDQLHKYNPDLINLGDRTDLTPLHMAVQKASMKLVVFLTNRSANIDAQDQDGQTPLHVAVQVSSQEITNHLLTHCPDLELQNKDGRTPMQEAERVNGRKSKLYFTLKDYAANQAKGSFIRQRTLSSATARSDITRPATRPSMSSEQQTSPSLESKKSKKHFWSRQ